MVMLSLLSLREGKATRAMHLFEPIYRSDTIAPTLVFAFYELARSPLHQHIILEEVKEIDLHDYLQLQGCEHLTALINETLRLYPPVPTGGYRQSPLTGMMINETYSPGNVTIVAFRYSLARLESAYECADQFIPERWTTKTHMLRDRRAFAPFSQGRFNCVGRNLAMREMRLVIAMLVKKFKVDFWEGEDGQRLFPDLRDQFTPAPGTLNLRFKVRNTV